MGAENATFKFRAKRERLNSGLWAYRVPLLTSSHVETPRSQQGIYHTLMFGSKVEKDLAERRQRLLLDNNLGETGWIFEDADYPAGMVEILPLGNGFMADVMLRLDLKLVRKGA